MAARGINRKHSVTRPLGATAVIKVTETQHQQALYHWWRLYARTQKLPEKAFIHSPNEGKRSYKAAAVLQSEGMQKGVPDIFIAVPNADKHGLWIELKTQTGRPTQEQKAYIALLQEQGYEAAICRGWEAARDLIIKYLENGEA